MGWVSLSVWASFSWCRCAGIVLDGTSTWASCFLLHLGDIPSGEVHELNRYQSHSPSQSHRGLRQASFTSAIGTEMPRSFQCLQSFCVMNCKTFARQSMPGRRCATLIRLVCGSRPGAPSSVAFFHLQNWHSFDIERCEGRGFLAATGVVIPAYSVAC